MGVRGSGLERFNRDPHFQRVMDELYTRGTKSFDASIGTLIFRG